MKLLVIGGSQFVGPHLVAAAAARGDRVTVFNRGQTASQWPAGTELRQGDRKGDLGGLAHGDWDAVVDTCGYLPRDVARMADALQGRVGRYVFISSVCAYADFAEPNHEHSPLGRIDDVDTEVVDGRTYGPLKTLCEAALTARLGAHALLIRPGLIVGPHDPTQRFTYWPARVARAARGGVVLAPGRADDPVQFIDARDVAAFALTAIDGGRSGPFNVVSPPHAISMGSVLDACAAAAATLPHWRWMSGADIERAGLKPWIDLPLWLQPAGEYASFARTETRAAQAAGLTIRPLAQTVADTLAWWRGLPVDQQAFTAAGLSPDREAAAVALLPRG